MIDQNATKKLILVKTKSDDEYWTDALLKDELGYWLNVQTKTSGKTRHIFVPFSELREIVEMEAPSSFPSDDEE